MSAFKTSPFPSPLGATSPPSGRYEGALLGLSALGPVTVRKALFQPPSDNSPTPLQWISTHSPVFYPQLPAKRQPLLKASIRAMCVIVGTKPPEERVSVDWEGVKTEMGEIWVDALGGKKSWIARDVLKLVKDVTDQRMELDAVSSM
jgi:transcription initiation factor TFIID subunit 6